MSRNLLTCACAVALAQVLPAPLAAQASAAPEQEIRRWVHVDSVSGTLPSLRTSAQRALVNEGFGVRAVAACDCLVESGVLTLATGGTLQIHIHVVKAPNVVRGRISVEAVVRADRAQATAAVTAADSALARVSRSFGVARIKASSR